MDYSDWYRELEQETDEEVWCISLNCTRDFSTSISEWSEFLRRAAEIRGRKGNGKKPRTSYAWYDEQASQLRFATAHCEPSELPFGCKVELQDSPDSIIAVWLSGPDHIPLGQLTEAHGDEADGEHEFPPLQVWAFQYTDG